MAGLFPALLSRPVAQSTGLHGLVMVLLLGAAASASAQWAWKDDNGRVVYSDRPPPSTVKTDRIVRQPANAQIVVPARVVDAPVASADAKPAPEAKPTPGVGPKTTAELEMEFRKRQQERAEAEKKLREEETRSAAKASDCERAKGYLRALEDGLRIERTDATGNREYLDDAQRAAEIQRTRKSMQANCG